MLLPRHKSEEENPAERLEERLSSVRIGGDADSGLRGKASPGGRGRWRGLRRSHQSLEVPNYSPFSSPQHNPSPSSRFTLRRLFTFKSRRIWRSHEPPREETLHPLDDEELGAAARRQSFPALAYQDGFIAGLNTSSSDFLTSLDPSNSLGLSKESLSPNMMNAPNDSTLQCYCGHNDCPFCNLLLNLERTQPDLLM